MGYAVELQLHRDGDLLTLSSPFWSVRHDLKQGGCVTGVTLTHGSGRNLVKAPIGAAVDDRFFECLETEPDCGIRELGNSVLLRFGGVMRTADGSASPVRYGHTYLYTLYSTRNELRIMPREAFRARVVTACTLDLDPSLDEYAWGSTDYEKRKPRYMDLIGPHHEDIWGDLRGRRGVVVEEHRRPWQVSLFARGREGLCFTGDSKQYLWDAPLASGCRASFSLEKLGDRSRIRLSPLKTSIRETAAKVDHVLEFAWYLIAPNVRNTGRRKLFPAYIGSSPFPGDEQVKAMARSGVNVISFMDDFDYRNQTRNYWHDGEFPPYPPEKMRELARFLKLCHSCGMAVIPYFAGGILSPEAPVFARHAREWYTAVKPDGQLRYHPAAMGGTQGGFMCPDSGWAQFLESYIKRCVDELGFDGYYLDYGGPRVCRNPSHFPGEHNGADGLIGMMQNLRQWLGDERIMIAHSGGASCWLMHHNVADGIVTLEEGKRNGGIYQSLEEFPPSIPFMGSAAVSLVPNVFFSRPGIRDGKRLLHQGISHAVLLDAIPYPYVFWHDRFGYERWQEAVSDPLGIYAAYRKLSDIDFTRYAFHGPDSGIAESNRKAVKAAAYVGNNDAFIVVSNTGSRKVSPVSVKLNVALGDGTRIDRVIALAGLGKFDFVVRRVCADPHLLPTVPPIQS